MKDTLQLLRFLLRVSAQARATRLAMLAVVLAGLIGGAGNTALLVMINEAIRDQRFVSTPRIAWFAALCIAVAASRFISQYSLANVASRAVFELRMRLCAQILSTPLQRLEQIGLARILAHLTDDIASISEGLVQIPLLIVNIAVIAGCLTYLGWLSWKLLLALSVVMIAGVVSYQEPVRKSAALFRKARSQWNELYAGFQGLTQGIKELQLHQARRARFYEDTLVDAAGRIRRSAFDGYVTLAFANSWGQILVFAVLGGVVFAVPRFQSLGGGVATGYTLVLLFMVTPLEVILNMIASMSRARVAAEQLQQLGSEMPEPAPPRLSAPPRAHWHEIRMEGILHRFNAGPDETSFALGPVDLVLEPGEIIFFTGGNGSGKTTLAKLLVGLYQPEAGLIMLDGEPVCADNLEEYRSRFTAIFSDFHLFARLLGLERPGLDDEARTCLELLRLDHKVRIQDGAFSTIDLSQGQRKRLALLTAFLEDRPIYVFDEWTADQEPMFREVFYRHLLPGLRERGKTVVVITHDDRYFDAADRVVELEYGRVRRECVLSKGVPV